MKRNLSFEQIVIPAQISYLPTIRNFISRIASRYQFSKSEINALVISVDEACTNIIKHGYRDLPSGSITVTVNVQNDRLIVELIDHGISFDPNQVSDPNLDQYIQNGKKGGLGIFIMKKFLDEIHYFTSGTVNILRLVKFRKDNPLIQFLLPIRLLFQRIKDLLLPSKAEMVPRRG